MHTYKHTYMLMYINTHVHTCIHTYMHTYIHTYDTGEKNNQSVGWFHCKWATLQAGHTAGHKTGHKVTGNPSPVVGLFRVTLGHFRALRVASGQFGSQETHHLLSGHFGSLRDTSGHFGSLWGVSGYRRPITRRRVTSGRQWFYSVGHRNK